VLLVFRFQVGNVGCSARPVGRRCGRKERANSRNSLLWALCRCSMSNPRSVTSAKRPSDPWKRRVGPWNTGARMSGSHPQRFSERMLFRWQRRGVCPGTFGRSLRGSRVPVVACWRNLQRLRANQGPCRRKHAEGIGAPLWRVQCWSWAPDFYFFWLP